VHHPIQLARPEASLGGDESPEEAAAFRRTIADHLSTTGALMIRPISPGPMSAMSKRDGRILFEPLMVTTQADRRHPFTTHA